MRPAILQLSKQGVSDNFLKAFPFIDVYFHVILDSMRTTCVSDMKHGQYQEQINNSSSVECFNILLVSGRNLL